MVRKLFMLGDPGSGKSTIARHIVDHFASQDVPTQHVSDYVILQDMCRKDTKSQQFQVVKHKGFFVKDCFVYDIALQQLVEQVQEKCSKDNELIIIEFARSNYVDAFSLISDDFLKNSSFLFLNVAIPTCWERICQRTLSPQFGDDHFVPKDVFKRYTDKDNEHYLAQVNSYLVEKRRITSSNIKIVVNNASWERNAGYVYQAVDELLISTERVSTTKVSS